jgi:hypothetical protein
MKKINILLMSCIFLWLITGEVCAYVMPLEQILGRVRKQFATLNTLIIEQATHVIHSQNPLRERVYRENVWLKTPRYERSMETTAPHLPNAAANTPKTVPANEVLKTEKPPEQAMRLPNPDATYRWLLMANPKGEISAFLSQMGIRIWDLGYDRCDGSVAYRVGARNPDGPRLLVDKKRFFPLLLSYFLPGDPEGRLVTVRFKDYRKIDAGWYPYEIEYALEDAPTEVYFILNLTANAPIRTSFFEKKVQKPLTPPRPAINQGKSDDQRLNTIMRNLEKKYQ